MALGDQNKKPGRLFTAILLPPDVIHELIKWQNLMENKVGFMVSKTVDENLHITLNFLGNIEQSKITDLLQCLGNINADEYHLIIERIELHRKGRNNGLVWAKVKENVHLNLLKNAIDLVLGITEPKHENFLPHITMFRFKETKKADLLKKVVDELDFTPFFFKAQGFSLMQSCHTKAGIRYIELAQFGVPLP